MSPRCCKPSYTLPDHTEALQPSDAKMAIIMEKLESMPQQRANLPVDPVLDKTTLIEGEQFSVRICDASYLCDRFSGDGKHDLQV